MRLTNKERNKLLKQFTDALLVFTVLKFVFFVSRTFFALYFTLKTLHQNYKIHNDCGTVQFSETKV